MDNILDTDEVEPRGDVEPPDPHELAPTVVVVGKPGDFMPGPGGRFAGGTKATRALLQELCARCGPANVDLVALSFSATLQVGIACALPPLLPVPLVP